MIVKQTATVGFGFLIILFLFVLPVQAAEGQMYMVGTKKLEMKEEPAHQAETVGILEQGAKVTTFQETFGWSRTFYKGKEVWVASQYLIPIKKKQHDKDSEKASKKVSDLKVETHVPKQVNVAQETKKQTDKWKEVAPDKVLSASLEIEKPALPPKHNQTLSGYNIVIDAGHGGKDSGAIGVDGVIEKKLTLSTAKAVAKKLKEEGASVTLTRSDDTFISLGKRVQISNTEKVNAFVSLHYNAFGDPTVGGINTFYYAGKKGQQLAKSIQNSLMEYVHLNDRGAKQANYFVLRNNNKPAVLVELGFITNPKELDKIQTAKYREKVSNGIADGLENYFDQ